MRPGEVLGLQRRDIDLGATFVDRRNGTERERGGGLVTLRDTKNALPRVIPLSPLARAFLADALKQANPGRDIYVFAADIKAGTPKPMEPQTLSRAMARRHDVFGELTPHRLRAMCAFLIERLGFGSAVARDVLGHVDGSVLRRSYSGFDGLPLRADALDAVAVEIERLANRRVEARKSGAAKIVPMPKAKSA
jgi:integrase